MLKTSSIRTHLLLLVLAVSIPLAATVGFGIYIDMQHSVERTRMTLRLLASTMVSNTGGKIAHARSLLERLAQRPLVRQLDAGACDPALPDLLSLSPDYSNIVYTDLDGLALCSAVPPPGGQAVSVGQMPWFKDFLARKRFSVGQPHVGPITGKWVSVLSAPIVNAQQQMIGAVHLPLDLAAYDPQIPAHFLPPESRYGFFDADGIMIWRNTDPEKVIGTRPDAEAARRIVEVRDGEFESLAVDGVIRYFSVVSMPETGWVAFVGLPATTVYAEARQRAVKATFVALLAFALLLFFAVAIARRIARPVVALEQAARAVHDGKLNVRAALDGPGEIAAVAGEFNTMLDAQQQHAEQLRAFLENSAVIAWLKDENGRFVFVSRNFLRRFSLNESAVLGKTDYEVWPQAMADEFSRNDRKLPEHGGAIEAVEPARNPDGSLSWWLSNKFVFQASDGKRLIGGLAVDITERTLAESDLRIAATAFESREGMIVTDAAGVILRANKAFVDSTGYSAAEIVGQTPHILKSGRHNAAFYREMWDCIGRTGAWQGEIWDRRKDGSVYPKWLTISAVKNAEGAITHYIGTHYDISERKAAEERINELAFFDPLTHLPNRTLLMDRMKQAISAGGRSGHYGCILFIDLDNFKTLNDTLGHDTGDLLLQDVAKRLTACIRAEDTVARLGGDEFIVVLTHLGRSAADAASQAETVGKKILGALLGHFQLGAKSYHCTASIGATLFQSHSTAVDDLLKQADLAMYKAKAAGRNTLRFFDPAMEATVLERAALETDLRQAIGAGQFVLHYQPLAGAHGEITGAEALLRWQHPQRGMVSPAHFIALAEETGLIRPLGHWVLETACAQLARWAQQPAMAHLTLAVNVSVQQFRQAGFVAEVMDTLAARGARPQQLKLELTESLLIDNVDEIIEKMTALKSLGVGFSLDDFGTGYSSLSYLKRLPLDLLKIDQSFVRDILIDPNDASIARTIVALAQGLGLEVIAEGVETREQRDFLAELGCPAYQGYFLSRPLPVAAFETFVGGR